MGCWYDETQERIIKGEYLMDYGTCKRRGFAVCGTLVVVVAAVWIKGG